MDLCLRRFTPAAASLFNLQEADVGRPLADLIRDFGSDQLVEEAGRSIRESTAIEREMHLDPDEWYLARLRPYRTVDGDVTGVVLTLVDITERRLLERQVVNTTERVRRQIGQDLHDILSSDLTALAIMLGNYRDELEDRADVDLSPLSEMARQVRLAADRARTLSHALVPLELQEEHLAAALENLCHTQGEMADPVVTFEGNRGERLPYQKETAAHLYRIAREAIVNARRHADAHHIRVRLQRTDDTLELTVRDDGVGLPNDLTDDQGIGLRTMRYRANLIGATLSLESGSAVAGESHDAAATGTLLRCTLPLHEAEAR